MGKLLSKISVKVHKYAGILLLFYILYMSVSGILLNHPGLIEGFSAPSFFTPSSYEIKNWNRGAFRGIVNSLDDSNELWVYGYSGIWHSSDSGKTFTAFMKGGFPKYPYGRKVKDLTILKRDGDVFLLSATYSGLYLCEIKTGLWYDVSPNKRGKFVKVYEDKGKLFAISDSAFYVAGPEWNLKKHPVFVNIDVKRDLGQSKRSLIHFFLHLHDGSIWGTSGKLIFDFIALIIIFLSVSAVYIWFFPKRWKRLKKKKVYPHKIEKRYMRFFYKYHIKLGIWSILFSIIIGFTGLFLTPPFIFTLIGKSFKESEYPNVGSVPWQNKIKAGYFDRKTSRLLLSCSDGIWEGDYKLDGEFKKSKMNIPISGMGATVFTRVRNGDLVVGSFSGLYGVNHNTDQVYNYMNQNSTSDMKLGRRSRMMVSGFYESADNIFMVASYRRGLIKKNLDGFQMPSKIKNSKISLWNWLFALHNGRIWKSVFGKAYVYITPVGALLFIFILLTGVYDYFYKKRKKHKLLKKRRV